MNIIEVEDLYRHFPGNCNWVDALNGVDLKVAPGEVIGLLGRNGAGKTTLLNTLMGINRPDAGSVRLFGSDPRKAPVEVKQRVGYVSEK